MQHARLGRRLRRRFSPARYPTFAAGWLASDLSGTPSTWASLGATGLSLTQSTGADQPTYNADGWLPNTPAVTFDGTSDHMDSDYASSAQSLTVFACINQVTTASNQFLFSARNSGSGAQLVCAARNNTTAQVASFDADGAFKDLAAFATGRQVLCWRFDADATTTTLFRNGSSVGTATYSPIASFDQLVIGGWAAGAGQLFSGGLFGLLVYESALSNTVVAEISAGLERLAPIPSRMLCVVPHGQSNAAYGTGDTSESEPADLSSAGTLTYNSGHVLATAANGNAPPGIGWLASWFCRSLSAFKGQRVYSVGSPQNGAAIALCDVGSTNHNAMLARVAAAGVTPTHFLYHQGETDAINSVSQATYQAALQNIINDARTRWPGVKCYIVLTGSGANRVNYSEAQGAEIRAAQIAVATGTDDTYHVDVDWLDQFREDDFHWNQDGYARMATAAMGVTAP